VISLTSVHFGMYIARLSFPYFPKLEPPKRTIRYAISIISVLIYAATLPTYFLLPASYRHQATAALLFAFPGTLFRYCLSIVLNPLLAGFPMGTFAANSIGSGLLAAFRVIQSTSSKPISSNGCSLLQGLDDGFCGCLTTISTFAVELRVLKGEERPRYFLISWGAGQLLFLIIMGPALLSGNVKKELQCSFT
jgi:fluoride exporter